MSEEDTVPTGQRLKTLRNGRNITVRDVEHASRRIADVKGDRRFCISNGWLAQLENGASSEPSFFKLFSLSVIYRVSFLDLLRLYDVDVDEKEKYEHVADPSVTQLITHGTNGDDDLMREIGTANGELETDLIREEKPQANGNGRQVSPIIYAHLGLSDRTMYPMIRPGALLKIDTSQNKLSTGTWRSEYERPIFFIELRNAYACGWCELQNKQLLIIPHHSSPASVRAFTYSREAEIVGRIVGYSTPCIDAELQPENLRKVRVLR